MWLSCGMYIAVLPAELLAFYDNRIIMTANDSVIKSTNAVGSTL